MEQSTLDISRFSSHLFWDVDRSRLDPNRDLSFIVKRILEYGLLADWKTLREHHSIADITVLVKQFRDLDSRSLSFISTLSGEPKENFRCYTMRQSIPPHWTS